MRWKDLRRSSNVRDVRGAGGGGRMPLGRGGRGVGGGIGVLVILGLAFVLGGPEAVMQLLSGSGGVAPSGEQGAPLTANDEASDFVARVLGSTEDVWGALFAQAGETYQAPELTLFGGAVQSACGYASAASGPFYCPGDHRVYLDTTFFDELARMGGPGDFAAAYVIGHEVGHHVQTIARHVRSGARRAAARQSSRGEPLASRDGAASRLLRRRLGESREPGDARARARRRRGRARRGRRHRRRSVAAQRRAQRDARLVHARLIRGAAALAAKRAAPPAIRPPAILSTSHTGTQGMLDHRLIDGRAVRDRILDSVAARVHAGVAKHKLGRLVSISIGEHKEVAVYVRGQASAAKKVGIPFEDQTWPSTLSQDECKTRLRAMNDDESVLGVILQRPIPKHIHGRSLASAIHPLKDIEGMNPASIGDIVYNDAALVPCTAAASVELIKATGLNLHGLEVVMIGHSEIVGKPAAFMLMAEGATVTVCHHLTRSVAAHSRRADAVLVAVGKPRFLRADMVKPGAAVIDIGINQIAGPNGETMIVGDVDTDNVKEVASWVTPVPGGVGPVTVAMFMRNAITAHEKQLAAGWLR